MFHPPNVLSRASGTALSPVPRTSTRPGAWDILVISPHEIDRSTLERRLPVSGWHLIHVRTCEEAVAVMGSVLVPAVICDEGVGGGRWRETIGTIFASPHPAPVLLAADRYDWRLWIETIDRGAFDLIVRPFDGVEDKLKAVLRHWRDGRTRRTWEQGLLD